MNDVVTMLKTRYSNNPAAQKALWLIVTLIGGVIAEAVFGISGFAGDTSSTVAESLGL